MRFYSSAPNNDDLVQHQSRNELDRASSNDKVLYKLLPEHDLLTLPSSVTSLLKN